MVALDTCNFNNEEEIIQGTKTLYNNASSAVIYNNQTGWFFQITAGLYQGCMLSPLLFNIYVDNIMRETPPYNDTFIGRGLICNLRFAYDIDMIGKGTIKFKH